ncbi:hypothetical protein HALLA_19220 [Halostagnicola larsenii XH-48]|uniref:Uncharacterized protein n=1 Tax=Halostagnicola larsenii XH-48 TaxID=797299 RepID=W0JR26_9EURY|nr:hypothetical protein HALLA_19220 [Halostagnicola larsenii XH-48]
MLERGHETEFEPAVNGLSGFSRHASRRVPTRATAGIEKRSQMETDRRFGRTDKPLLGFPALSRRETLYSGPNRRMSSSVGSS